MEDDNIKLKFIQRFTIEVIKYAIILLKNTYFIY